MTTEQMHHVIRYAEEENIQVQITRGRNGIWTADFSNDIHARVCCEGMNDEGLNVVLVKQDPLRLLRIA